MKTKILKQKKTRLIVTRVLVSVVSVALLLGLSGCPRPKCDVYDPEIDPADFVLGIDNPFLPLVPGTTFVYQADTDEGLEEIVMIVTDETKEVMGVICMVVRDTETVDGELLEDTFDWFAQDIEGNVWYFGEDSSEYEDGEVISTEGSWEAGVDGAQPGIIMLADPMVGDEYRQEFYCGEAEDDAEVVSLTESVVVPYGSFDNCLQTEETTDLEPDVLEHKFYAEGVGFVLALEEDTRVELISVTTD